MKSQKNKKLIILGSTGLLGNAILPKLSVSGFDIVSVGRTKGVDYISDVFNYEELCQTFIKEKPDIVLNLIAKTDVDHCEKNLDTAMLVNARLVSTIVDAIINACPTTYFVQVSTDQIYNSTGLSREHQVEILNAYGASKYAGEFAALRIESVILRTNFFGRGNHSKRQSFSDWIFSQISLNNEIKLLKDVFFNPISIDSFCDVLIRVLREKPSGVFNLGSKNGLSKFHFGLRFLEECGLATDLVTGISYESADFFTAKRPRDMRMCVVKLEDCLNISLPNLEDEIKKVTNEYV